MVKEINLKDKQGQPLKRVTIRIDGDTPEECERVLRGFVVDVDRWVAKYAKAATKDGTTADGRSRSLVGKVAMQAAEQKLKKIFDDAFGEEVYPAFFNVRKPFAAVGGNFYCDQVMTVLHAEIIGMIGGLLTNE